MQDPARPAAHLQAGPPGLHTSSAGHAMPGSRGQCDPRIKGSWLPGAGLSSSWLSEIFYPVTATLCPGLGVRASGPEHSTTKY